MAPARKKFIVSLSSWAKKGMAAGAYGLTWLAILISILQAFLVVPPKSWAVTGGTTLTVVPSPPSGLTAIDHPADDGGAIDLSWTPSTSTGVTEQRIYRAMTTGGPYSLATTITNNTTSTYTDSTGLTNGTTYYYVIRAFGGGQESGNSNEASAAPVDNLAPSAPTFLTASDVAGDGGGAINLSWTPSASTDVTQQRVYRSTNTGGPYSLVTTFTNNTTSSYTDTGLTNGTTYYYAVRAYDGTQESGNSSEASATPINNPPFTPTGLTAADTPLDQGGSVDLSWTPSTSPDVVQQRVYRSTTTGGPYSLVTTITNNTTNSYTDPGLTTGTTYYYIVRAFDGTQESANSNEASAIPVDNTAPTSPIALSAADVVNDNGGAVDLSWTPSTSTDVTQQRVYRSTTTGGPYALITTITNNTTSTYRDTGLTNGTTYYYVIRGFDGTSESANSNEASVVPIGPPAGTFTLTPNPLSIPADGTSTSTVTSGTIKDFYGNTVLNGTLITVSTNKGTITTADADAGTAGIQVATSSDVITFTVRSDTTEGTATVSATSVLGSASGQTTITFTNVAPELNYPAETGYGNGDALEPNSGIRSTTYRYKVVYKDVNNNLPSYVRICIGSSPCTAMSLDTGAVDLALRDGNYSNGEQYVYSINTLNSGDHTYYLETSDGLAYTKLPSAGSLSGPHVNYPPELSYSSEAGYVSDGVDPDSGNTTVTFKFKVVYRDLDNQAPTSIRVCIDGGCYAMALDTAAATTLRDGSYTNGEQYIYSTLLADGTHNYYFDASDSLEGALLPTSGNLIGPIVTNTYTPAGTNVFVNPDPDVTVTFTQVTASGDTYVTNSQTGSPLPSGYLHGVPPAYFDIYTTATYTGKVNICYTYDDIQYFGIGYGGERGLRWLHYESGSFKDRTITLDVINNMVCGEVYSFSEFSASVEQATLVTLTSFTAIGMDGQVLLTWATASEVDSMGFNILRGTSPDGPFTRINDWVIRSKGTATRGMTYTHEDIDVKGGTTYFYRLENVDINGRIAAHMIASATPAAPPVAEEVPESSETLSPAAPGSEMLPSGEETPEVSLVPEALTEVIIYREVPAAAGVEPPPGISEFPVTSGEGEAILRETTDTGKETLETMPVIRDRAPEGRPAISEPAVPEARRVAPKGFTLKIADDAGNEMEVSLPEETESVQDPFEVVASKDGKIALKWSAKGNLKGFNVLRVEVGQGKEKAKEYVKVNVLPMPFFASQGGDKGLVYHFKDAGAGQGKMYSYKVETIFSDGTSRESRSIEISTVGMGNAN